MSITYSLQQQRSLSEDTAIHTTLLHENEEKPICFSFVLRQLQVRSFSLPLFAKSSIANLFSKWLPLYELLRNFRLPVLFPTYGFIIFCQFCSVGMSSSQNISLHIFSTFSRLFFDISI